MAKGNPILTLRLRPEILAALQISARKHGLTVSDHVRALIEEQLQRDGISAANKPIDGQLKI